jgi:hypothetical protein
MDPTDLVVWFSLSQLSERREFLKNSFKVTEE